MYIHKLSNADIIKLSKDFAPNSLSCIFIKKPNCIALVIDQTEGDMEFSLTNFDVIPKNKNAKVWMKKFDLNHNYFVFMSEKFGEEYEYKYFDSENSYMKSFENFYNV